MEKAAAVEEEPAAAEEPAAELYLAASKRCDSCVTLILIHLTVQQTCPPNWRERLSIDKQCAVMTRVQ
jgi:hypothetical protein